MEDDAVTETLATSACVQFSPSQSPAHLLHDQVLLLSGCPFADSIGGSFPVTSHRCHHKQKNCPPALSAGGLPATPLLFHPHTKGSQILMDLSHKAVKRQASFCNAITFSNRPVLIYEQVRLKVGPPPAGIPVPNLRALSPVTDVPALPPSSSAAAQGASSQWSLFSPLLLIPLILLIG